MLPKGIAHPRQLAVLTKVLEDYCREAHIEAATPEFGHAGRLVWSLYESGISKPKELEHALRLNSILIH